MEGEENKPFAGKLYFLCSMEPTVYLTALVINRG
jgi:hypothetical protein